MDKGLWTPPRRLARYELPSYVKLDMAFGIGEGAKLMDKSRYRAHGTISGAAWADGLHGRCLDFDRTANDYVGIPAAYTHLDFTSEDFSLVCRVKINATFVANYIYDRGEVGVGGWQFLVEGGGTIYLYTSQAAAAQWTTSASGAISPNTRYTLGMTRAGAVVTLFRNGADVTATPQSHTDPAAADAIAYIGINAGASKTGLGGKMEFLRVFGGLALPASAHLAWHNALA